MSAASQSRRMSLAALVGPNGLFLDGDWVESKDQDPKGDVRLIQLADVGDGVFVDKSARFLTSSKARDLKCTFLERGDILIARMPDPLGRACVFPGADCPCVTVVDVCIVRPPPGIERRWLLHAINSQVFRGQIEQHIKGTTRLRISRTNLGTIELTVPPLPEQRRIADILDKADAIRRKRKVAIALTEELLRSAFLEMFGDPVTNPKGWPMSTLVEIAEVNRGKFTPRPRNDPRFYNGEYPFIQTGDLTGATGYLSRWRQTLNKDGVLVSRRFPKGAIAITIAANIGDTAIVDFDFCCPDSVVVIEPRATPPEYLECLLRFLQPHLDAMAPETAQKNINLEVLRPLQIIVPPKSAQQQFAAFYKQLYVDKRRQIQAATESESLFSSLLHRAFRGELTAPTAQSPAPTRKQLSFLE